MRKILFLLVISIIVFAFITYIISVKSTKNIATINTTLQPLTGLSGIAEKTDKTIVFDGKTYAFAYFSVSKPNTMSLIPNFTEKLSSQEIASKYGCVQGINGGFYTTDNKPLGGFMTGMDVLRSPVKNRLIDGFLWSEGISFHITLSEPISQALFFLQTGPLLKIRGETTRITINNDEEKRRHVAALSKDGDLIFFTIYNPESVYEGPFLADIPSIMNVIETEANLTITDSVNLDGGSASAFITEDKTLQEFSPIGSFFCVK